MMSPQGKALCLSVLKDAYAGHLKVDWSGGCWGVFSNSGIM